MNLLPRHTSLFTRILITAVMAVSFCSCTMSPADEELEQALIVAGPNRAELERVLAHYEGDTLSLAAARYLITNMPGHYSYADTAAYNRYSREVAAIVTRMADEDKLLIKDSIDLCAERHGVKNLKPVQDIRIVTADFLIANIDDAMDAWQHGRWARHLTFDEFCEYLLPYKPEELQPLDNWRQRLKPFYGDRLRYLDYSDTYCHSALGAAKAVSAELRDSLQADHMFSITYKPADIETRAKVPFGTCDDYSVIASAAMISKGIPIVRDITPQWGFRRSGHSWNVLLSNDGRKISFSGCFTLPGDEHKLNEKMAKAYRRTYRANPFLRQLNNDGCYVPPVFRNIFLKDVTSEYITGADYETHLLATGYAYLAVYDDMKWEPVAVTKTEGFKARFENVGKDIVYMVVRYDNDGRQHTVGHPFVIKLDGSIRTIKPTAYSATDITLKRKYPVLDYLYEVLTNLDGGEFQASDDSTFATYHLVHRINDCHGYGFDISVADSIPACRYWRYYTARKAAFNNMAEMEFYRKSDGKKLSGRVIGTDGSWWDHPDRTRDAVFDGNILTYMESSQPDESWVGIDFGRPVRIGHLRYYGRGDGNAIEVGDQYELMMWKDDQWISLGRKYADRPSVTFSNIPEGGLFLLKDITKGNDERIFTYEGDRQVWW